MSKTITIISAVVLVLCLFSSPSMGQSSADAIRLYNEANALSEKARSNEDLKKAVQKYEEALSIFRKVGNVKGEGQTLGNLGTVYRGWGQYPKAVEYYEKSLQIFKKIGDVKAEGATLLGLGNVYEGWGQYPKGRILRKVPSDSKEDRGRQGRRANPGQPGERVSGLGPIRQGGGILREVPAD